jgi:plastocyanin
MQPSYKRNKYIKYILVFSLVSILSVFCHKAAKADQCFIVKISEETKADNSQIWLYPEKITVAKGNCIVWVNFTERHKVSITFQGDGQSCIRATGMNSGFMALENCFFTDFLSRGQTVSLLFKEAGVFKYQLEIPTKEKDNSWGYRGKIVREGVVVVE